MPSDSSSEHEIKKSDAELGPSTEAKIVRDSVKVEKRRGNLVQQLYFSEEDLRNLLELVENDE